MRSQTSNLLIELLDRSETDRLPLAKRLQNNLRELILDGTLESQTRLPPSRTMAIDIGVSRDTVETAYQYLEMEGFLIRKAGSGTFVAKAGYGLAREQAARSSNRRKRSAERLKASSRGTHIAKTGGVIDHNKVDPFVVLPDVDQFPLATWEKMSTRTVRQQSRHTLLYGDPLGFEPLREEVARYLAIQRGVNCDPEQVVILSSSQQALWLIGTVLMQMGDRVAIENPSYHGAKLAFETAGMQLDPIRVDAEGLDVNALAELEVSVKGVYLTPSHQYPTGVTLPLDRRLSLLEWAANGNRWIIEDDYDSEYRYDGRPVTAIQSLDKHGRVLYVGTFSKVLFPSLRLAYLVLPQNLVATFTAARTIFDGHSPTMSQATLAEFMRDGHFTSHIRRMRQLYQGRRVRFLDAFHRHLSEFAQIDQRAAHGLHVTSTLNGGLSEAKSIELASELGIELPSLSRLYLKSRGRKSGWLMGFAALTPAFAEQKMRQLAAVLKKQNHLA